MDLPLMSARAASIPVTSALSSPAILEVLPLSAALPVMAVTIWVFGLHTVLPRPLLSMYPLQCLQRWRLLLRKLQKRRRPLQNHQRWRLLLQNLQRWWRPLMNSLSVLSQPRRPFLNSRSVLSWPLRPYMNSRSVLSRPRGPFLNSWSVLSQPLRPYMNSLPVLSRPRRPFMNSLPVLSLSLIVLGSVSCSCFMFFLKFLYGSCLFHASLALMSSCYWFPFTVCHVLIGLS